MSWSRFESTVAEAQKLAQPEDFDYLSLLDDRYTSVRKFAPLLLLEFEFHAAPAAADLLQALDLLRALNASGKRTMTEEVPTSFVKPRWRSHVFGPQGSIDRHFYESCALSELRDRLRAGDVWVRGSGHYRVRNPADVGTRLRFMSVCDYRINRYAITALIGRCRTGNP